MPITKMADGKAGRHFLATTKAAMLARPKTIDRQSNKPSDGLSHTVAQSLFMPNRLGSWDAKINSAAACVKPASTGDVTRLSSQPARTSPRLNCTSPDRIAIHAASTTHWAEPGSAMPVRDAPISRADSAVGPTPKRGDGLNKMATAAGMMEA